MSYNTADPVDMLIRRAEFTVKDNYPSPHIRLVGELLTALKATRAQRDSALSQRNDANARVSSGRMSP